jgi:hypothetical protein
MIRKVELQMLSADLAALDALLNRMPDDDVAARVGLDSRRREVEARIKELGQSDDETTASVALHFGGPPVIGSRGIQAEFAGTVIANYQDLVSKIWATDESGQLPSTGPVKDKLASQLHVTEIAYGSFGFVLEEIDELGTPMFRSPLKEATARATELMQAFAFETDEAFEQVIEALPSRVFAALRDFIRGIHREEAIFRIVEGDTDVAFDRASVDRAHDRAETYSIEEEIFEADGELLGVIPIGRRFEFKQMNGEVLKGNAGVLFSQSYLERIEKEQLVGKRWRARMNRRQKTSFGKMSEIITLLELHELDAR